MADDRATALFEDAQIIFKNFSGKEGMYNREGDRSFAVIIPDEKTAEQMLKDGWNVKRLNPREEGDEPKPYLPVAVGYRFFPPRIILITERARTNITEDTVETLDWVNMRTADLMVNAYEYNVNGKTGKKAYLKSLYVTIDEDYLEKKYALDSTD